MNYAAAINAAVNRGQGCLAGTRQVLSLNEATGTIAVTPVCTECAKVLAHQHTEPGLQKSPPPPWGGRGKVVGAATGRMHRHTHTHTHTHTHWRDFGNTFVLFIFLFLAASAVVATARGGVQRDLWEGE